MTLLGYLFCAFIGGSMLFGWWWIERHESDPWEELAQKARKQR